MVIGSLMRKLGADTGSNRLTSPFTRQSTFERPGTVPFHGSDSDPTPLGNAIRLGSSLSGKGIGKTCQPCSFCSIFAQVSLRVTVRLKTGLLPLIWASSRQK